MILVTTDTIAGKNLETLGLVQGNVVRAKHLGRDIMAGLKSLAGGEIRGYTELMIDARRIATDRMVEDAKRLGADAVVCVRYSSCSVMDGASEVMAFGTAVKFC